MRLNKVFILILFSTISLYLTACDILSDNSDSISSGLIIETDQTEYSISDDQNIEVNIFNNSRHSIFISSFVGFTLEKKVNDSWESLLLAYLTVGFQPLLSEIKPGESFSPSAPRLSTNSEIIESAGLYRFNFGLYTSKATFVDRTSWSDFLLPLENRVSNTFQIVE